MENKIKAFEDQVLDVKEDGGKGIVTIAISAFDNVDSYGDIVRKGAFKRTFTDGFKRHKHVTDHSLKQTSVVGLPLKMYENSTHAIVESALNLEKQIARDLYSDYKFFKANGRSLEHSYMYQTIKRNENNALKGEDIAELKMYEYSTVALGANDETPLLGLKGLGGIVTVKQLVEELEARIRAVDYGKKGEEIYKAINLLKQIDPSTIADPLISTPNMATLKALAEKL
jgi:hypothetical protein